MTEKQIVIDQFLDALWLERGLSENTLSAYRSDLHSYSDWLASSSRELLQSRPEDILAYLASLSGMSSRTSARRLSSLRRFFQYLAREGRIDHDPCARIAAPRIGRPLPKSLTEAEVEGLLAAPDTTTAIGQRDRAMLEVLYATGLRVSELVALQMGQVNLRQGVVRVVGKGNKERLVPLGDEAADWLEKFIRQGRAELLQGPPRGDAVSKPPRTHDDAPDFLARSQAPCRARGDYQNAFTARTQTCVCHSPAEPWRGFAGGADVAGTQRYLDDTDLYPRCQGAIEKPPR